MDDRSLYATILGLEDPWEVERVELKEMEQVVDVWVRARAGTRFVCPECGAGGSVYDHVERSWRHLDTCQFRTLLHAGIPRITCPTHGVRTIRVPWAERHSHFTLLFERLAIAWLKEAPPLAVARRLGLTWEEANGIIVRAVRRGLARRPSAVGRRLGIDEHSYLQHFEFVTAEQGAAAIPILDTAFSANDNARSSIVETWGRMLAVMPPLDSTTQMAALTRIARQAVPYPFAISTAAQNTQTVPLLPALYAAYSTDTDALSQDRLLRGIKVLRNKMATESPSQLLGNLATGTAAACAGDSANGQGACEAVRNLIATAARHVQQGETLAARNTIDAIIKRAGDGQAAGEMTPALAQYVVELARAAEAKL